MLVLFSVSSSTGASTHAATKRGFRQNCSQLFEYHSLPSFCEGALRHRNTKELFSNDGQKFGIKPCFVAAWSKIPVEEENEKKWSSKQGK